MESINVSQSVFPKEYYSIPGLEPVEPKTKNKVKGIGNYIIDLILEDPNDSAKNILAKVMVKFPTASTTTKSIYWYRNDLKKRGILKTVTLNGTGQKETEVA